MKNTYRNIPKPYGDYKLVVYNENLKPNERWEVKSRDAKLGNYPYNIFNCISEKTFRFLEDAIEYCHSLDFSFAILIPGSWMEDYLAVEFEVGSRGDIGDLCIESVSNYSNYLLQKYDIPAKEADKLARSIIGYNRQNISTISLLPGGKHVVNNINSCYSDSCFEVDQTGEQIECGRSPCGSTLFNSMEDCESILDDYRLIPDNIKPSLFQDLNLWYVKTGFGKDESARGKLWELLSKDLFG